VRIGVVKRGCLAPQTWLLKMFKTLTAFPEGKHDDQVVALGLVGQLMDKYVPGHVPKKEPENEKWRGYAVYDQEKPLSILTQ
jgi:hypothetical protein